MKARNGQVALYLVLVLVAIAVLMLMNVSAFLAVRSKNRMMNAVDEAALAAAKVQGDLLNQVGWMNVRHLQWALKPERQPGDVWPEMVALRDLVFLRPLQAVEDSRRAAESWGFTGGGRPECAKTIRRHIDEIVGEYVNNPDLYPEYRENQWLDYASQLGAAVGDGLIVSPGYMETANAWSQVPLLSEAFYDAIAARAWCWFSLGDRERFLDCDSRSMPRPEFLRAGVQENSELFSLHVTFKSWKDSDWAEEMDANGAFSERWTNFICRVTGVSPAVIAQSPVIADENQLWAFYDDKWGSWSRTFNPDRYPIAGSVRPEYDVAGCAASCLMLGEVTQLLEEGESGGRLMQVTAEAKPIGTVPSLDDGRDAPVTAYHWFVATLRPDKRIFSEAQLVLMGSVPRSPGVSLSPAWYDHVKDHLPAYLDFGACASGCYYCRQLNLWENPVFRNSAREWLLTHSGECTTKGGRGDEVGGYDCAH